MLGHSFQYDEPPDFPSSPTLVDHEAPQITEEEPNTPFFPCPPPFLVPMWLAPYGDCKVEKSVKHVPKPSSHLSTACMEEVLEWLSKPITKTHSSIPQEDVTVHNSSLEYDLHLCHPPSSTSHDSLYHDLLDQSTSLAICSHSLDSPAASLNCDQAQGSHITQVEEHKGEDTINIPSLIQNCAHQNNELPFLNNSQFANLGGTSCTINYFDQPPILVSHHSHASICHDECPSACHEDFNSDLECALVK